MKKTVESLLLIVNIVSFVLALAGTAFTLFCEWFGYPAGDALLKRMYIPLDSDGMLLMLFISAGMMVVSYVIRKNVFR